MGGMSLRVGVAVDGWGHVGALGYVWICPS